MNCLAEIRIRNVNVFQESRLCLRKILTCSRKIFTCIRKNILMFKKISSCLRKYLHVKGKKYMFKVRNIFQGANIILIQFA